MANENLPEQRPEKKTRENGETFQSYIKKLQEAGFQVIDTTKPRTTTVFVGGVRKPKK